MKKFITALVDIVKKKVFRKVGGQKIMRTDNSAHDIASNIIAIFKGGITCLHLLI